MSPQHLQLVINRLDYTLNKNTFKVDISFQVLNDYGLGLGGEKSTYYKHICSGPSSPEVQKTQGTDIHYSLLSRVAWIRILLSGQCGGLDPGQAVPLPPAGLHRRHQEGRGMGQVS